MSLVTLSIGRSSCLLVMMRLLLLLLLAAQDGSVWAGYCSFQCSDRPYLTKMPDNCPYFQNGTIETIAYNKSIMVTDPTTFDAHLQTVAEHITTINGSLGWCGLYDAPYEVTYLEYCSAPDLGIPTYKWYGPYRQLIATFPLPWCVVQSAFGMCVAKRRTPFDIPGVITNRRPLPISTCNTWPIANPTTFESAYFPLWDTGGYYRGTTSVYIDDACVAAADISPTLWNRLNGNTIVNYMFAAREAVATFAPAYDTTGHLVVSSFIEGCNTTYPAYGSELPEDYGCAACNNMCTKVPQITCLQDRDTPIANPGLEVRLVCRDPDFGYGFKVSNNASSNTWVDWTVKDTYANQTLLRALPSSIVDTSRYRQIYEGLSTMSTMAYPLWPNVTDGHGSASATYFYISTFKRTTTALVPVNASDPNTTYTFQTSVDLEAPFEISIYAGLPDYYVGNHKLAALVEFVNMTARLNVAALKLHTSVNWTHIEKDLTKFSSDLSRQVIIALCANATFRAEAQPWVIAPLNLVTMCNTINNRTMTWPDAWAVLRATLGFSTTAADPVPACKCVNIYRTPCGQDNPYMSLRFTYDYTPTPPPPPLKITVAPVCRVVGNPFTALTNVPPPPDLNNTGYLTALLTDAASYRNRLVPPFNITTPIDPNLAAVTYSSAPLGVLWRINNIDTDTGHAAVDVRWAVGNYAPPGGSAIFDATSPVPYNPQQTIINIPSSKSYWLFSRTTSPHKLAALARMPCITPEDCAERVPTDDLSVAWADHLFVGNVSSASSLPLCQCYQNAPCNGLKFLFLTDSGVDVSLLDPVPGTTPPTIDVSSVTNCIPTPEVCNGLDDDCNGLVDDVAGVGLTCGYGNMLGACTPGTLQCNLTLGTLVCQGAGMPTAEKCGGVDYDCDGILSDVVGLGLPCGSDVAPCKQGTLICPAGALPGSDAVCSGAVLPVLEICGDGIDDDCNGLIDDGCAGAVVPPPPPPAYAPHPPVSIPTQNTLPALQNFSLLGLANSTLGAIGLSLPSLPHYDLWVLLLVMPLVIFFLGACLFSATRVEGVQVIRRTRGNEFTLRAAYDPVYDERKKRD